MVQGYANKQGRKRDRQMMKYKAKVTELITNGVPYEQARSEAKAHVKARVAARRTRGRK